MPKPGLHRDFFPGAKIARETGQYRSQESYVHLFCIDSVARLARFPRRPIFDVKYEEAAKELIERATIPIPHVSLQNEVADQSVTDREFTMSTVTVQEAQAHLGQLIERLQPGEEVIITCNEKPVACLTGAVSKVKPPRKLGTLQGTVLYMAPDFNVPLDEMKEYMG